MLKDTEVRVQSNADFFEEVKKGFFMTQVLPFLASSWFQYFQITTVLVHCQADVPEEKQVFSVVRQKVYTYVDLADRASADYGYKSILCASKVLRA